MRQLRDTFCFYVYAYFYTAFLSFTGSNYTLTQRSIGEMRMQTPVSTQGQADTPQSKVAC